MDSLKPKKLLLLNILDILQKYSDENHRLSQQDIIRILKADYDMPADRKSVKRNLMDLEEFGFSLNYKETLRRMPGKNGALEESYLLSDFYLERDFTDSELRLLIDSVLFSGSIPAGARKELIRKLKGLSSRYFRSNARYIASISQDAPRTPALFYTIEILDEAIAGGKQVIFEYCSYQTDLQLHPKLQGNGQVKEYLVNPYQMAAANGKYYLIGNCQKHEDVIHFRLDRIQNIRLTENPVKPMQQVRELTHGLNLPRHMAEHIYMFAGDSVPVKFRMKKYILNDVVDWFGRDLQLSEETQEEVTVRVRVNRDAMRHWAMQYARHVVVLEPPELREQMKKDLENARNNYD